jgi:hypothetical protein
MWACIVSREESANWCTLSPPRKRRTARIDPMRGRGAVNQRQSTERQRRWGESAAGEPPGEGEEVRRCTYAGAATPDEDGTGGGRSSSDGEKEKYQL